MNSWSNAKSWQERWGVERHLDGGGQASAKAVRLKQENALSGDMRFLKVLNRQSDLERRARFFREATAYSTANYPRIPRLIESNAQNHTDGSFKLYIVTEFIFGESLSCVLAKYGTLELSRAISITRSLLDVIAYCHEREWVHRDIKPDNIIIKANDEPFLLDFGIAYSNQAEDTLETEIGQELGNRFMRLPELSAFSNSKKDKRSDVAFVGGIFFYTITGISPCILLNEHGQMPHQTSEAARIIQRIFPMNTTRLLEFFDRAFGQRLVDRFSDAEEMKVALNQILIMKDKPEKAPASLTEIVDALDSKTNQELVRNKKLYDSLMDRVKAVHSKILKEVVPTYHSYQSGYVNFTQGLRNTLGFAHFATLDHRFAPEFIARIIGDELVLTADGRVIYRTSAMNPIISDKLDADLEEMYVAGLSKLVQTQPV